MIRKKDLLGDIRQLQFDLRWAQKQIQCSKENRKSLATVNQLQCAAKGHNFVFDKILDLGWTWLLRKSKDMKPKYQFKCSNCGLTIVKTTNELTTTEKKALKDLGILEEKENGKTK